jgi:hypothetical protein
LAIVFFWRIQSREDALVRDWLNLFSMVRLLTS